jgi:DNA-binding transcriptional MocR family regulator
MMLTIPVLAYGFGVVSPQNQRHFILTWVLATGLMSLVMLLALADVLNSWYVLWRARRVMMRRAAKARQLLLKQVVEEGHEASNASVS